MDVETLARAMEPFFTTKGVGKGTGLGLSMIHGFAEQVGGTFLLKSEGGGGTSAEIWLPASRAEAAQAPAALPVEQPIDGLPLTILAVDDDAIILMNTAALLEDMGHRVLEATSGDEALTIFRATPGIDLIVIDFAMPGMNGVELAEHVCAARPDMPKDRPARQAVQSSGSSRSVGRDYARCGVDSERDQPSIRRFKQRYGMNVDRPILTVSTSPELMSS
jgi:CheY-like chemotaxis protein